MELEPEVELRAAVAQGLVPLEDVERLRAEAKRSGRSVLDLLRAQGRLSEETLSALRGGARASAAAALEAATLTPETAAAAPAPSDEPAFPVPGWDRYQPVRFLGQGGMGQVFLAYDVRLHRNTALKFVRHDDPGLARRSVSEARAQASVSHERVCEVYDVGEVQGRVYIAMQYVDGQPLGALARELSTEQKVLVLRDAAEGVHAAHRVGLIHRDLKPSNIMVERPDGKQLKPYVMDFGLARDWKEPGAVTSAVQGTPSYMAPEQARGQLADLDRRADVYGLGATLYHVLTGRPPFTGASHAEVLARVLSEPPRPPRELNPDLPTDLEAIVLKCLEKDRSARYGSARALAEDLERFLDGEPVLARAASTWYRLARKARKHRIAVSLGAAALLVVGVALGQVVQARREAAWRERFSRDFTERVERIESTARYSALAPLHDTRPDRQSLREMMASLEAEIRRSGERAQGPGHYALGRGLYALGSLEGARTHLEAAWESGLREPRVAYALALVMGRLYQEQLTGANREKDRALREARRRLVERRYREPALAWLKQSEGAETASPRYAAALLAFYEGRYEQALGELSSAAAAPWFYESPLLRGHVLLARAAQRWEAGQKEQALADFDAGRRAFTAAASIGQSTPDGHLALAELEYSALVMQLYSQGDVQAAYARAQAAVARALETDPENYEALVLRARLERRLAEDGGHRSEDMQPALDRARDAARHAQAVAPERSDAWLELSELARTEARSLQQRGQDPRARLQEAIEAFDHVRPDDRDYGSLNDDGVIFKVWAEYEDSHGGDPLPLWERAIEAFRSALELDDRSAEVHINLGVAFLQRASYARAPRPDEDLAQAAQELERALSLNPGHIAACYYAAKVHDLRARRELERGGDPMPELARAQELFRKALAINAQLPALYNGLGSVLLEQVEVTWETGGDPTALIDESRRAFERARDLAPKQGFAYNNLGEAEAYRATYQRARGEDPTASVRAAVAGYQEAVARLPEEAQPYVGLAKAQLVLASWAQEHGRDALSPVEQALSAADRALQRNPRHGYGLQLRGEALGVRARARAQGAVAEADFEEAAKALQGSVDADPSEPEHRVAFGHLACDWAAWRRKAGGDPTPLLERGLALAEGVLALRPRWARAQALRARVLSMRAEAAPGDPRREAWQGRARADLQEALAHNPNLEPGWRRLAGLSSP